MRVKIKIKQSLYEHPKLLGYVRILSVHYIPPAYCKVLINRVHYLHSPDIQDLLDNLQSIDLFSTLSLNVSLTLDPVVA
jgi:hypothetical protein